MQSRFLLFLDSMNFFCQDEDDVSFQEHETGDNQSSPAEELQKVHSFSCVITFLPDETFLSLLLDLI